MTAGSADRSPKGRGWGIPIALAIGFGLAALAIGAVLATRADDRPAPKTVTFVVPEGTARQLALGKEVTIMPSEVRLNVGDTLVVRNDDDVTATVGPFTARVGETITQHFQRPQTLVGECSLSSSGTVQIVVT